MCYKFNLLTSNQVYGSHQTGGVRIGFSVNKYKYNDLSGDADIINTFNKNEKFKHEDFFLGVKLNPQIKDKFLQPAINFKSILFEDYKIINGEEILSYVWNNFSPFIEREIEEEKVLFNQFKIILNDQPTDKYYLINMKFFDLTYDKDLNMVSDKITSYDAISYSHYFVVKWFEANNILNVALFSYD